MKKVKNNKKSKINKKFWNQFTNEEVIYALLLVIPPDKIVTPEDLNEAEKYFENRGITYEMWKEIVEDSENYNKPQ